MAGRRVACRLISSKPIALSGSLEDVSATGDAAGLFVQELAQGRFDCFGPDSIAFLVWMEEVGHDVFGQRAVGVEELISYVQIVDLLPIGQSGSDATGF